MAADRRARGLTEDASVGQRTLDAPSSLESLPETILEPDEVLEPPPPQHASARLEERQKRWFQLREAAVAIADAGATSAPGSAENSSSDPKG